MKKKSSRKKTASKSKSKSLSRKRPAELWGFKDLLSLKEVSGADLDVLFKLAEKMKKRPEQFHGKLRGRSLALLFEKPSMRTRVSFEVGMSQLGGLALYMSPQEHPLGDRESIKDIARVLSRYCDAAVIRTYAH